MSIKNKFIVPMVWDAADALKGAGGDQQKAPPGGETKLDGKDPPSGGGDGKTVFDGLGLAPDNLEYVKTKGWQSPDDVFKSYKNLESEYSQIKLPSKDSKPEEVDAFYNKLGRPEKPEGYEFKLSDKVPEHFPYEENNANEFKGISHKLRLTAEQAQGVHDWYVEKMAGTFTENVTSSAKKIEAAHDRLVKDFGSPEGEQYKRNVELADRTVRELGKLVDSKDPGALRKELADIGAITPDGKVMAPLLIAALSKVGDSLYSEDKVYSGLSSTENPWKTEDLTRQGKIITEDPELARQLILAANLKPADYGLK